MRNNFKKFAALALVLVMLVSTFVPAFATTDRCPGVGVTHTSANCDYVVSGELAATCTTAGYVTGKCLTCNTTFEVSATAPTGHVWSDVQGDCVGGAYKKCTVCDEKEVVEAAQGHKYSAWTVDGGCFIGSIAERTCTVCGNLERFAMTEDHIWVLDESTFVAPEDCTKTGSATYNCGVDGCTATKTEVVYKTPGTNHARVYLFTITSVALADGTTLNASNAYTFKTEDIVLASGVVVKKEAYNQAAAADNKYATGATKPSCHVDAKEAWFCSLCGEVGVDTVAASRYFPAHNWVTFAAVAPTCEKPGNVEYEQCSYCGDIRYNTTGFFTESGSDVDGTPVYVELTTAASAYAITTNKNKVVAAPMHHIVTKNYVASTCVADGSRNYYCEDCNALGTAAQMSFETIAKKGHEFFDELSAAEQAYYIQVGMKLAVGAGLKGTAFLAQVNSTCKVAVTYATCTTSEFTTYTCHRAGCTETKQVKTGDPLAHVSDAGTLTAPTCTAGGKMVYACQLCGAKLNEVNIDATGHDMSVKFWVTTPDCQTEGKYILTCSVPGCAYYVAPGATSVHVDLSENILTAPKAHVWVEMGKTADRVITCATLDEDRKYDRECTVCHKVEYDYVAPAVDHVFFDFATSYANGLTQVGTKGDCTTQGVYYIKCYTCFLAGLTRPAVREYLDPNTGNGHNKVVLFDAIDATCTSEGWTEGWMCTNTYCTVQAEAVKMIQPLHFNDAGTLLSIEDMLINKNMIDLYVWDLADRKLGTKLANVTAAATADVKLIVAVKRGATIKNGLPVDANDFVKSVAITDTVNWVFYVPGSCSSYGVYGGLDCTVCKNADCVGLYDYNSYCGITNWGDGGHVWNANGGETKSCTTNDYDRQICKHCELTRQINFVPAGHTYVAQVGDKQTVSATCELDGYETKICSGCGDITTEVIPAFGHMSLYGFEIVNSCIDRTGDRFCVLCATNVPKDHQFGDWTADNTRTCALCATVETKEVETEPVVTEPEVTEPEVTEPEETKPEETKPVETKPVETTPVETEPADEKGCGSSIAAVAVALVAALGTCVVFAGKKRD